jgi:hypothetical protein
VLFACFFVCALELAWASLFCVKVLALVFYHFTCARRVCYVFMRMFAFARIRVNSIVLYVCVVSKLNVLTHASGGSEIKFSFKHEPF